MIFTNRYASFFERSNLLRPDARSLSSIRIMEPQSQAAGDLCAACHMPFDTGKKRRLIDTCGHERCYMCMFSSDECPLCEGEMYSSMPHNLNANHIRQTSDTALLSSHRPKLKTNGHYAAHMHLKLDNNHFPLTEMATQTTPKPFYMLSDAPLANGTPPVPRRKPKFFSTPLSVAPPPVPPPPLNYSSNENLNSTAETSRSALSVTVTSLDTSDESHEQLDNRIIQVDNQRIREVRPKEKKVDKKVEKKENNAVKNLAVKEGHTNETESPPPPPPAVAQNDLMMRLGLLLGNREVETQQSAIQTEDTFTSVSSLASSGAATPDLEKFSDTSPMSTLTGVATKRLDSLAFHSDSMENVVSQDVDTGIQAEMTVLDQLQSLMYLLTQGTLCFRSLIILMILYTVPWTTLGHPSCNEETVSSPAGCHLSEQSTAIKRSPADGLRLADHDD
ncbi:uncharacterized protein LOC106167762 [Lingula anatina]|uniref:Uncharacterized protein LOC106167762 n=1 Tax=Lingula anatina TaxID=7574 RepID=A0A2R2MP36_LINAN|nr:uncharacterized protein LOC106167762 [Lingula anatina]|eukprot:XP_023931995.1 uncharacterized protein LOC106167762 [Lingula anatina]